jgi:hypothetical protein
MKFIELRPRQPFDPMAKIIAEQAGGAALERRQAGNARQFPSAQFIPQGLEWIDAIDAAKLYPAKRIGGQIGITGQSGQAAGAIQE